MKRLLMVAIGFLMSFSIAVPTSSAAAPQDWADQQLAYTIAMKALRSSGIGYNSALCRGWRNPWSYGSSKSYIVSQIVSGVDTGGMISRRDLKAGVRRAMNTRCGY